LSRRHSGTPTGGTLVWLTMVTGHRRGELCGIRWRHVDIIRGVLHLERAIGQRGRTKWEKETKDHQDRRVTLDPETLQLLRDHRARAEARAVFLGVEVADDSFVFSRQADGSTHLLPDSVGQRFRKLTSRLRIDSSIHKLRHYSATELIAAGVDVRTVAGPAWPWGRYDNTPHLRGLGLRGRSACRGQPGSEVADPAGACASQRHDGLRAV